MSADIQKLGDAAPFTFDVNFAAPQTEKPIPTVLLPDHELALKEAEERGRLIGLEEGKAGEEARLANEARRVADAAAAILAAIDGDRTQLERDSAALAFSIGKKLAGEALSRFPLDNIEALISECLGPLRTTPHLVVRLHEKDAAAITDTVGKFARESGFDGRFVVLGEPDFTPGDCRIEWADGGIIRNLDTVETEIETSFQRYFAALDEAKASADNAASQSEQMSHE
ncbi:MAG: FliH/SctL family protein [Hyphomicrobiales bacterium]